MTQDHSISDDGFCFVHTSRSWMRLVWMPGTAPSGLWNHTASLVHAKILVVIGGKVQKLCDSVRMFDIFSGAWQHVPISTDVFSPRTLHAALTVGSSVLIHGGCLSSGFCSDELFSFDAVSRAMKRLAPRGKRPGCRCRHSLNLVVCPQGDAHVVCYGGSNDGQTLNDLWVLNCSSMIWQRIDVVGERPSLEGHTALTIKNRLTMFVGGYSRSSSGHSQLDWPGTGVFVFDISTKTLATCHLVGDFPRKLIGHATSHSPCGLLVFGGMMPDGNGDASGIYISSDVFMECDRIAASMRSRTASDASQLMTRALFSRTQPATSDDEEDSDSASDSRSSAEMDDAADGQRASLLSQVGSLDDLLLMEQQLQLTLKAISALREDGLLEIIETKCKDFLYARERLQATESVAPWVGSVLSRLADKELDVRLHTTLTLIKHVSSYGMFDALLKEMCSSLACTHVVVAASTMCKMWTIFQYPDAMARFRRLCAQQSSCYQFTVRSLQCIRAFCSLVPDGHELKHEIIVCECILSTAVGSLNCQHDNSPFANPISNCFVSDIQRACAEICRLAQAYFFRIVLRTPAQVSSGNVETILKSCSCVAQDSTTARAISIFLAQSGSLWETQVKTKLLCQCSYRLINQFR